MADIQRRGPVYILLEKSISQGGPWEAGSEVRPSWADLMALNDTAYNLTDALGLAAENAVASIHAFEAEHGAYGADGYPLRWSRPSMLRQWNTMLAVLQRHNAAVPEAKLSPSTLCVLICEAHFDALRIRHARECLENCISMSNNDSAGHIKPPERRKKPDEQLIDDQSDDTIGPLEAFVTSFCSMHSWYALAQAPSRFEVELISGCGPRDSHPEKRAELSSASIDISMALVKAARAACDLANTAGVLWRLRLPGGMGTVSPGNSFASELCLKWGAVTAAAHYRNRSDVYGLLPQDYWYLVAARRRVCGTIAEALRDVQDLRKLIRDDFEEGVGYPPYPYPGSDYKSIEADRGFLAVMGIDVTRLGQEVKTEVKREGEDNVKPEPGVKPEVAAERLLPSAVTEGKAQDGIIVKQEME